MTEKPRRLPTGCQRCGTCCIKGGPALHWEDRALFDKGVLERGHLYTLRKGEAVRHFDDSLKELKQEIIKIKGRGSGWTCLFYDPSEKSCTIYEMRPIECRALKCWDLRELKTVMKTPYLTRRDLLGQKDGLLKLIDAHDQRCRYDTLKALVREIGGPDAEDIAARVLDLLQYDDFMRPFLTEKLHLEPSTMDFLFGRPLTTTIRMYGLQVKKEGNNRILVPIK